MERSADWMRQAGVDLAHAQNDIDHGFYEWASFSSQQAAEKAVKAVFQKLGAEAWGHSLFELLQGLATRLEVGQDILSLAQELDKAYIPSRYPNAHPAGAPTDLYNRVEAERLFGHAERIVRFCQGLLATL